MTIFRNIQMVTKQKLREQRHTVETLRQQSILKTEQTSQVNESIASSWQRSVSAAIPKERSAAPLLSLAQNSRLHWILPCNIVAMI
jgi:hypothetical protein